MGLPWIVRVALNAVTSFLTGGRQSSDPHTGGGRDADGEDGYEDASLQDQGYSDTATSQGALAATRAGGGGGRFSPEPLRGTAIPIPCPQPPLLGCTAPPGMGANSLLFQPPSLSHSITCQKTFSPWAAMCLPKAPHCPPTPLRG